MHNTTTVVSATISFSQYKLTKYYSGESRTHNDTAVQFFSTDQDLLTEEEQLLYPLGELASDIGGCLGLLLGASVMSVFEGAERLWLRTFNEK